MDNKAWLRLLFSVIKQLLKSAPMKSEFQKAVSMDETIKAELSVDMSEVQSQEVIEVEFTEQAAYTLCLLHCIRLQACVILCLQRSDDMSMIDTLKMLYKECQKLDLDEATQLILEAETEEEQEFYFMVSDFVLQQRQKKVIEENWF